MTRFGIILCSLLISFLAFSQEQKPFCENLEFHEKVDQTIAYSIPVLDVKALKENKDAYIILDAREVEEYKTSHIPGAHYVGYEELDLSSLEGISKDAPIVVYCSIGYRSEKVGEKISQLGFRKVFNLYGSIFEWANRGYPLIDVNKRTTLTVHTYNKKWSQWMINPEVTKIW